MIPILVLPTSPAGFNWELRVPSKGQVGQLPQGRRTCCCCFFCLPVSCIGLGWPAAASSCDCALAAICSADCSSAVTSASRWTGYRTPEIVGHHGM